MGQDFTPITAGECAYYAPKDDPRELLILGRMQYGGPTRGNFEKDPCIFFEAYRRLRKDFVGNFFGFRNSLHSGKKYRPC